MPRSLYRLALVSALAAPALLVPWSCALGAPKAPLNDQVIRDATNYVERLTARAGGALQPSDFKIEKIEVDKFEPDQATAVVSYKLANFRGRVGLAYRKESSFWKFTNGRDLGLQ